MANVYNMHYQECSTTLVVLLPGTDVAGAMEVAENIREAIHRLELTHTGNASGVVTVSAGVEAFAPVRYENQPVDLIVAADKALYQAKASGRNRVCAQAFPIATSGEKSTGTQDSPPMEPQHSSVK